MRGLGTDHVISGPMRGDSMTESAQWGRLGENPLSICIIYGLPFVIQIIVLLVPPKVIQS